MATDLDFMTFVYEQVRSAGDIRYRKMFGEYAIYCDARVVALVCDNQLFVKPTPAGRAILGREPDAPPYPGAKSHHLIEDLDDAEALSRLIAATARELPLPAPRKPRTRANAKKQ
jgi:TfoX/Sxy family transcriptional regulator of competence genes